VDAREAGDTPPSVCWEQGFKMDPSPVAQGFSEADFRILQRDLVLHQGAGPGWS